MPTKTIHLKTATATEKEIDALDNLLDELSALNNYFANEYAYDAIVENEDDFPILYKLKDKDYEQFFDNITKALNNMRWKVVIFNLRVLRDNCIDKSKDTLEFSPEIRKGLEMLSNDCPVSEFINFAMGCKENLKETSVSKLLREMSEKEHK